MKQIGLKVTTLSPLSIRSDQSPTGTSVAPYIAGSTLMGSLASAHRLLRSNAEEEFASLFLKDKVQYPNLHPALFEKNKGMQEAFAPIYCVPRTAQSCKRFSGFLPLPDDKKQDEEEKGHGVRDSLLDWATFALANPGEQAIAEDKVKDIIEPLESYKECAVCHAPLDNFHGFYRRKGEAYATATAKKRLLTRTGINRKYGTIEEEILYNREVYEKGSCFFGIIQAEDDIAKALLDFLREKGMEKEPGKGSLPLLNDFARLGTARTRGLGQVDFISVPVEDTQDRYEAFKQRLHCFDKALRNRAEKYTIQPFYFALTLHAPTILCDDLLRYEGTISGERLASMVGLDDSFKFTLLYHTASIRRVMGWQQLWGLPRIQEYALEAGSVLLFASTQPLNEELAQALSLLEERGIGQRRAEGFGRICISDSFHQEGDFH